MRFLGKSAAGLFLVSAALGLLVYAGAAIQGAVQERMADAPRAPEAGERVFAVDVLTAEAGPATPVLTAYGEVLSRRTLELRAAAAGRGANRSRAGGGLPRSGRPIHLRSGPGGRAAAPRPVRPVRPSCPDGDGRSARCFGRWTGRILALRSRRSARADSPANPVRRMPLYR